MARTFGQYSPVVPLGVTWEEQLILEDVNGVAIDLTGYDARAQFYEDVPTRDPDTGIATVPPIAELTTPGVYVSDPGWPFFEALSIPTPADGTILSSLDLANLWTFSTDNAKRKLFWSLLLVNPDTDYAIPVVEGRPVFLPAKTIV
ncbi:MAG TPA: hypothetical protein VLE97_01895 [Gaiellaceae bacterium]|nr:hypothetical protein [Gaiellaceae bacterium]